MSFVVTAWKNDTPSTSLNVVTSLALHDVAIAWGITDGTAGSFTWPSGFTELKKQTCTADAQTLAIALKKDCTGSEGTLTIGCNESCIGGIIGISGGDNTTQPDVTTPAAGNNNTAQASAWTLTNSITPTTNGSLIVALMGSDITASSASAVLHTFADTGSLSWTTHANSNDGGFIKGGIGSATQATAAATTVTGTGTLAGKSAGRSLILVAVRPAAGGGINGTLSSTLGAVALSSDGSLAIQGTLSKTLSAVTASSAGALTIQGASSVTLGNVALSSDGTSVGIAGSLSAALDAATLLSAGTLAISGASSISLAQATLSSNGSLAIQGSLSVALDQIGISANGGSVAGIAGDMSAVLSDLTLLSDGLLSQQQIIVDTGSVPGFVKGSRKKKGPVMRDGQVFGEEYPLSPDIGQASIVKQPIASPLKIAPQKSNDASYEQAVVALMRELL